MALIVSKYSTGWPFSGRTSNHPENRKQMVIQMVSLGVSIKASQRSIQADDRLGISVCNVHVCMF